MRTPALQTLLAVLVLVLAACRGSDGPEPSANTPVILISIDTLRSDHLPAYGYRGVQTPHIDAFRRDALLFERAYSHTPLTLPSHATIFTGLLPADNGIRDNTGYQLTPSVKTMAELLAGNGYAAGAAVSTYVLRKGSGVDRGFGFYDDDVGSASGSVSISAVQREGSETVRVAKQWVTQNASRPLLFFLHLYEPHTPYAPPEPYRSRYASRYDGEIARADELVGDFLEFLRSSGLYDRALIILFSDHGEGLGDHGEDEHGIFLYREAIQVPLLMKLPRSQFGGEVRGAAVQLSDIFPTVLELTETRPISPISARSLLNNAERSIYSETYFPKFHFGWSDLHSLIDGNDHYIHGPGPELYNLTTDFGEKTNVIQDNRRRYAAMRRSIEPLIRSAEAPAAVDPEEAAKLAALGYLGGAVAAEGPLPDPKTKTETFRKIREAFKKFREGEYAEALAFYQSLLKENPRMLDLWDVSARALMKLGRHREAIDAAREGLKLSPQTKHLALLIASLALEIGDLEQAEKHAELALDSHPADAHGLLARVAIERNDLERATREAALAQQNSKGSAVPLMLFAEIEKKRENHDRALAYLDEAVAVVKANEKPPPNNLHFLRGDVLARLGRAAEAEEAFRKEIALFPEETQAYKNLILLYVADGRLQEATRLIFEYEKADPTPPTYVAISETLRTLGDSRGARFWAVRGLRRYPDDPTLKKLAT